MFEELDAGLVGETDLGADFVDGLGVGRGDVKPRDYAGGDLDGDSQALIDPFPAAGDGAEDGLVVSVGPGDVADEIGVDDDLLGGSL